MNELLSSGLLFVSDNFRVSLVINEVLFLGLCSKMAVVYWVL
jgi:hypothetical protein